MSVMASLNISLPSAMKDFVERRVERSGFSTPSEYVRALIREDWERRARERLDALLLEGLGSGDAFEMTPEDWESKRQRLIQRHDSKRKEP